MGSTAGRCAELAGAEHAALRDTVRAVIDHWGEPRRAADVLGVHANTVRNRMSRFGEVTGIDLGDPSQRLAVRLELHAMGERALAP